MVRKTLGFMKAAVGFGHLLPADPAPHADRDASAWAHLAARFDAHWYDHHYGLADCVLHGFSHYVAVGAKAGYSPNALFDEKRYLERYGDVADSVQKGGFLNGFDHFVQHGEGESRSWEWPTPPQTEWRHLAPFFDADWYDKQYRLKDAPIRGLEHYLADGLKAGNSPNARFDEHFYRAFYQDVRQAIAQGRFICGFEHYVLAGRYEGRIPTHDLGEALDTKCPGLTLPVAFGTADEIMRRLAPLPACPGDHDETVWFLLPSLNPDLFFGGYKAAIELIIALTGRGRCVRIILCGQDDDGEYGLSVLKRSERTAAAFRKIVITNRRDLKSPLRIGPYDTIFAYSAWEAYLAHDLARFTHGKRFAFLVQEYEPVFHDHGDEHAVVAGAYRLPHYPIFNSIALRDYFEHNALGVFGASRPPVRGSDYAVFEHILTKIAPPSAAEMGSRAVRRLVLYARPEQHARRNLFALALLALRSAVRNGLFIGDWEFYGVGSLKPHTVSLGPGAEMYLLPKMDEASYARFMRATDIGLSLMYAPHPGLVAFEFASVGARVVTNVYENRSAPYLRSLSENIIPCEPTPSGIEESLSVATATLQDIPSRVRGMTVHREAAARDSWPQVFDADFFETEMAGFFALSSLQQRRTA